MLLTPFQRAREATALVVLRERHPERVLRRLSELYPRARFSVPKPGCFHIHLEELFELPKALRYHATQVAYLFEGSWQKNLCRCPIPDIRRTSWVRVVDGVL